MFEGGHVVAGEAILSGAMTTESDQNVTLEIMVRQYSRLVYRIAFAVLRRHHDAEDATQETFVRVLRYKSNLARVDDPKTWLARIAWRVAVDRSKLRARIREIPLDDSDNPIAEPASPHALVDATLQGTQVGAVLEKLIASLPAKLREPLILSTIEEMSPKEVACTLGIQESTVRSRVFRARHILKEKLQQAERRSR